MRIAAHVLSLSILTFVGALTPAAAQTTCGQHRAACESVCTPNRVAGIYAGSYQRCTASCEPRWQECLKTGIWVDLERRSHGGSEYAPPF